MVVVEGCAPVMVAPHDYTLADGDLLSLDLAVSTRGAAADSAISFIVGDSQPSESVAIISATERALSAGIAALRGCA